MNLREVGALFLVLLTACSGVPRVAHPQVDAEEAQLAAARYELRVLTPDDSSQEPVVVSKQDFHRVMRMLAAEIPPPHNRWRRRAGSWRESCTRTCARRWSASA
jgi:hypothetical protein